MRNIKNLDEYIKENILFPRGGNIGGDHKKPVTDEEIESGKAKKKGYKSQRKGLTHDAYSISVEKSKERKINLMGDDLSKRSHSGYSDEEWVKKLIDSVENYNREKQRTSHNIYYDSIKSFLNALPEGVIEHFNINLDSSNLVEDFVENKFELFKRSYDMFKEISNYPNDRYEK